MDHCYDIFEVFPDGGLLWKCAVNGREEASLKLREMAAGQDNEYRVMHLPTKTVIETISNRQPTS